MHTLKTTAALIAALFAASIASAATFSMGDSEIIITMTGEISKGDAERLANIFIAVKPLLPTYHPYPNSLYLNSPGGDVSEAIRIAELVKTLGIQVVVVPDGKGACASSCFLIYVAALERSACGMDTLRNEGKKGNLGPLGVHRPYLPRPAAGPAAARRQEEVMAQTRAYLVSSGVGHALVDKMMAHASNDIYWLNAEEVRSLGQFSPGVEEQLIASCGYNAKRESNLSARDFIQSSHSGVLNCIRDYLSKVYSPLREAAVDRMRKGWRPWK